MLFLRKKDSLPSLTGEQMYEIVLLDEEVEPNFLGLNLGSVNSPRDLRKFIFSLFPCFFVFKMKLIIVTYLRGQL